MEHLLCFLITIFYPYFVLVVVILVMRWNPEVISTGLWVAVISLTVCILTLVLFTYIANVVLDAVTTLFVCYAVARDNQVRSNQMTMLEKLLPKSVPIVVGEPVAVEAHPIEQRV